MKQNLNFELILFYFIQKDRDSLARFFTIYRR